METLMKPQMGVNSEKATDDYLPVPSSDEH